MKYSWLLVDADGTVFDFDLAESTALGKAFKDFGLAFKTDYMDVYRRINAKIWLEFERGRISQDILRTRRFELLFRAVEVDCDIAAFSTCYLEHLAKGGKGTKGHFTYL